jgi:hypothetical protein
MAPKHKPAPSPPVPANNEPAAGKPSKLLPVLVIAGITVVIIGILLLKDRQQPAVALAATPTGNPTAQGSSTTQGALAPVSGTAAVAGLSKPTSPSDQLQQALAADQPVLVFMHSTNCQSCIDMMKVVDEVYPEFAGQTHW